MGIQLCMLTHRNVALTHAATFPTDGTSRAKMCGPHRRSPHMLLLSTSGMALHGVTDKQAACATVNKGVDRQATDSMLVPLPFSI